MNYKKIYDCIIFKAKSENRIKNKKNRNPYYEAHHIIPTCMGGTGNRTQWRTHPNIILLTAREHFLCHLLLCEIYPENVKIQYACWLMCNKRQSGSIEEYKISNRVYERLRISHSDRASKNNKGRIHSEQSRKNMSSSKKGLRSSRKGVKLSEETKEKLRLCNKGKISPRKGCILLEETKDKLRKVNLGKVSPNRKKIQNIETGEIYDSLQMAAKINNIPESSMCVLAKKGLKFKYYAP